MGDSVHAALDPIFDFDRIYTFEPVENLAQKLRCIKNNRLTVVQAGLFDTTCKKTIYHAGTLAGSIYADAPRHLEDGVESACGFIEASQFFRENIKNEDVVYMKLNCEGSECSILENLLDSGEIQKVTEVLIDFDALKIPSQRNRVDDLLQRIQASRISYHTPEQVQYGMINNYGAIRNWLLVTGAAHANAATKILSALYQLKIMLTKQYNGYYKMRVLNKMPMLKRVVNKLRGRAA